MDDLQRPCLFYNAIYCGAEWAVDLLACSSVLCFDNCKTLYILKVGTAEALEKRTALRFLKKHSCTSLTWKSEQIVAIYR